MNPSTAIGCYSRFAKDLSDFRQEVSEGENSRADQSLKNALEELSAMLRAPINPAPLGETSQPMVNYSTQMLRELTETYTFAVRQLGYTIPESIGVPQ